MSAKELMPLNCGVRGLLRVPWTARRSTQSILKEINSEYSLEGLMLKLPFHAVHGVLKAGMLKWFSIPFSSGPNLSELSTMTCPSHLAPHGMAHSFTELDKAVGHVIRLVSFL